MKIDIVLTPKQSEIINNLSRFNIIRAGRRFGKTWLAVYWLLKKALSKPNQVCWYLAQDLAQSKEVTIPLLKSLCPDITATNQRVWTENKSTMTFTFFNGSTLVFKTADTEENLRGRGLNAIVLEECAFWRHGEDLWLRVIRPSLSDKHGEAMFISSPNGSNWFRRLEEAAETKKSWRIFTGTMFDNPHISEEERQELAESYSTRPDEYKQEFLAEYVDKCGTVYWELADDNISQTPLPTIMTIRGMDWGMDDNTAAVLITLHADGRVWIRSEYVANNLDVRTQGMAIKAIPTPSPVHVTMLDSSAFSRIATNTSVARELAKCGIVCKPATRDFDGSVSAVKSLLHEKKLIISPSCSLILKAMREWQWGEHEPDVLAAMRYGLGFLLDAGKIKPASAPAEPKPDMRKFYDPVWREKMVKQFRNRNGMLVFRHVDLHRSQIIHGG